MAQLVAHLHGMQGVRGSSPLRSTKRSEPRGLAAVPVGRGVVADLARFVTATEGNPVVRAAIAHAQFETIHPFIDGNGRTGRALIHTVLKRADALRNTLIPISTVFAGDTNAYIAGLGDYLADPQRLNAWIITFAHAAELAAQNAVQLAADIRGLDERTIERLVAHRAAAGASPARPRADAVSLRILESLATDPVLTIETVTKRFGVSTTAAHSPMLRRRSTEPAVVEPVETA